MQSWPARSSAIARLYASSRLQLSPPVGLLLGPTAFKIGRVMRYPRAVIREYDDVVADGRGSRLRFACCRRIVRALRQAAGGAGYAREAREQPSDDVTRALAGE